MAVVRKNSVTHRKVRGSIGDAIPRGSDWHGLHMIPRGDGAHWPFGSRTTRAADREHQDPAPCAGARHCHGGSMISEGIADAIRIVGTYFESNTFISRPAVQVARSDGATPRDITA